MFIIIIIIIIIMIIMIWTLFDVHSLQHCACSKSHFSDSPPAHKPFDRDATSSLVGASQPAVAYFF